MESKDREKLYARVAGLQGEVRRLRKEFDDYKNRPKTFFEFITKSILLTIKDIRNGARKQH